MREVIWDDINIIDSVNRSYNRFLQIFLSLCNEYFPKIKIKLKPQKHFRPWKTLGMRKENKDYMKNFFKTRKPKVRQSIFEIIKRKSKRNCYSQKIL